MGKLRKVVSTLVIVTIVTSTIFTGCGEKDKATGNNVKGRYVETTVELPKELTDENNSTIRLDHTEEGLPVLYVAPDKSDKVSITRYEMQENGKWKADSPEWLQDIQVQSKDKLKNPTISINDIFVDNKGNQYLTYSEFDKENGMAYLCMTTDGKERTYLTFDGWNEKQEMYGTTYYNTPQSITVLKNGDILAEVDTSINIYDAKSKEIKESIPVDSYSLQDVISTDENVFMIQGSDETGNISGVASLDINDYKKEMQTYTYDGNADSYSALLDTNKNGDIIMLNHEGIQALSKGTSLWNTVVIGELNTMYMPDAEFYGMFEDQKENYYVLYYIDKSGYYLEKYQYDKDIVSVPDKNITVYTLNDDMMLRQAAVQYNKKHPDTMITIDVAMAGSSYKDIASEDSTTTTGDYIKTLNTQLLAGSGPDILVTDGLPVDSYIEKSVLLDIKDTVQPMIDSKELLSNVMEGYNVDDHMYTVPARIEPYYVIGDTNTVSMSSTFDGVVEASKQKWKKSLLGEITPEEIVKQYLPTNLSAIIENKDGKKSINHDNLTKFLTQIQTLYENTDGKMEVPDGLSGPFGIAYDKQIALSNMLGFYSVAFDISIMNFAKGSMESYENAYMGALEMGINAKTKHPDIAKEFIQLVLSQDLQDSDYSTGIPVNNKSIDKFIECEEKDLSVTMDIQNEDGDYVPLEFTWMGKDDREKIAQICRSVNNRVIVDAKVVEVVQNQFKDAIANGISIEDCVNKIENELNLYLSE
jgi:ABC-type glycerol-3-phosphate transport system substrate-binding protein